MRTLLVVACLFLILAPAAQAAQAAQAATTINTDQSGDGWFRMWCWDEELIYTTPGFWIGGCRDHLTNDIIPCFLRGDWCPPGTPPGAQTQASSDSACLTGASVAEKVRTCAWSLLVEDNGPGGVRILCLDRQFEDNTIQGATWQCVDYQVFEKVVCVEVRC